MKKQSYENHSRFYPLQHYIWLPLSFLMLIGTIVYLVMQLINGDFTFETLLLVGLVVLSIIAGVLARNYALKMQDRLIRTEEQFRYFILTKETIDSRLTIPQLIALRFSSDAELPVLAKKAADEGMTPDSIKKSVVDWRSDFHRV
ncbi:DUF6526 family protein [Sporosarcina sp. FA9]|uniref:DUF6526 family protein n=1 Tax=Sporosarcina sp. FA9 TaxID=3413030 RepID=UPI003F65CF3E